MNSVLKLILSLIIAFEISFINNLYVNIILIIIAVLLLLFKFYAFKAIFKLFLIGLIPAIGILISQLLFGQRGPLFAYTLFTRIYAYIFIGFLTTKSTNINDLIYSLQQNFKVPSKFCYGILAAFNLQREVKHEIKIIKNNSAMRGINISWYSPSLYFKAILTSLYWADNLSQAMESQGYKEDSYRTYYYQSIISNNEKILFVLIIISFNLLFFI
ncbi:energy-coupling factor transporter transmembrane protein EcfT [Lactobacillus sp. S2-2]|uniref:energy-coupling factor transporter transmembrane component T family protein n=1 Tax=Lactobacillus sp. S2-2 TaxID=2692917 RepID=UPI001F416CBA|nr:energy-coupling factor transporter transmembrane component T [Lactobacillus sp. S2-2]MCF6514710.1 energy-coupling factor transporter transmembrane protein EcfT [Lactobacillus sp. S2-2]